MRPRHLASALLLAAILPALAADDAELRKDLASVIALQGLPCGEVTAVQRLAENDYVATCKDGNRYRVTLSAEGRVVVRKQ
jgi:hypothetical protein